MQVFTCGNLFLFLSNVGDVGEDGAKEDRRQAVIF
jgi:hypothetical protein